jgi:putative ABC transport system permease protein
MSVLVASFVVFATVLSYDIVSRTVLDGLSGTSAETALVVSSRQTPLSTARLAKLRGTRGVAEAVGRGNAYLLPLGSANGEGLDLSSDPGGGPLSDLKVTAGRYPAGPNEVAASVRTAKRANVRTGSTLTMRLEDKRTVRLTVTGIVTSPHDTGANVYAPDGVVEGLAHTGFYRVDIRATPGADVTRLQTAVQSAVGDAEVRTGAAVREDEAKQATNDLLAVFAIASMFVAIAVVAAGLVATSTFRIVFTQRMRQLALLRAVGAGRGSLVRALTVEGLLVGAVAGLTGVGLAAVAGQAVPLVAAGFGADIKAPGFPPLPAIGVVLGAMLVTLIAVLSPAVSASKVAPLEALRTAATAGGRKGISVLRALAGAGFALVAAGAAAYVWSQLPDLKHAAQPNYDPGQPMLAIVFSGAMAYCALLALGPVLLRPMLTVVGWPLRRFGPVGRLAVGGVGGAPRRAAAVSVVVALGVTLIAGVLVGAASLRTLADRNLALSAPADLELRATGAALPATTVDRLRQAHALRNVTTYRRLDVKAAKNPDVTYSATDVNLSTLPTMANVDTSAGALRDIGPGKALFSGYALQDLGLRPGDSVEFVGPAGKRLTVVVAVALQGSGPLHAGVVVAPSDLDKLGAPALPSGLLADAAAQGEDGRAAAIAAVNGAVGSGGTTQLDVLADQRDQADSIMFAVLAIALGLVGLTVIIAVVGVATTTALSVVERVRESGLLRAVGLSRGGLRAMLTTESGLYGVIGAALGLLIGVPYAWLTVLAMGVEAPLELPLLPLAGTFVALALLTAAAGVLPARKAAKVSPVAALGSDE